MRFKQPCRYCGVTRCTVEALHAHVVQCPLNPDREFTMYIKKPLKTPVRVDSTLILILTKDEIDILSDAMHDYMEFYRGKKLAADFKQTLLSTQRKVDALTN